MGVNWTSWLGWLEVNGFQQNPGGRSIITCYSKYIKIFIVNNKSQCISELEYICGKEMLANRIQREEKQRRLHVSVLHLY